MKDTLPQPNRNYRDTIFRMLFREKKELPLREAVEKAVRECIEEDILADFLRKTEPLDASVDVLIVDSFPGRFRELY